MLFKSLVLAAISSLAIAQRPSNTSICDYYTTALLTNNTGANQYTLLTLLVNTVVIGNYTQPNHNAVPGILAPGNVNGTAVNLAPFFSGALASSNRGGSAGVAVNFLDGGGAAPLKMNMPANSNTTNQYALLTHLYEFFGALLGCSEVGMTGFPAYAGQASMYEVHKFMVLTEADFTYFVQQVGLAATSFGVTTEDATAAGTALQMAFGYRCSPQATIIPAQGPQYQSICTDGSCALMAANDTCGTAQAAVSPPANATAPAASGTAGASMTSAGASAASGTGAAAATASAKSSAGKTLASYAGLALAGAVALVVV